MPEYLSKEEVKQWRSSLEKITLEEYAARLGKVMEEEKQTNDLVDIVLRGQPVMSKIDSLQSRGEKISSIAKRSFEREKEISNSLSVSLDKNLITRTEKDSSKNKKVESTKTPDKNSLKDEVRLIFSKALTDREQLVFEHFAENKNQVVYAKDLAKLLDLPRDYVYKYIKNLRAKIEGDNLQNSENGGYILTI